MKIAKFLISPALGMLGILKKPKAPQLPKPATRDDAAEAVRRDDELRRRQGGAADIVNGIGGAEPTVTPGKFVPGN